MIPIYIFDLDGTLALTEHRQHLVRNGNQDWDAFFEACDQDKPNISVIKTLQMLSKHADIWVWSGRSDAVKNKTVNWLRDNEILPHIQRIKMRGNGDHTPDDELKLSWFNDLFFEDQKRVVAVFDDRAKVVKMWRAIGVPCFQVAEGDF